MSKRNKYLLIIVIIAICCVALAVAASTAMDRGHLTFLESAFRDVMVPLQSGAGIVYDKVAAIPRYFTGKSQLTKENEELKQQINDLQTKLDSYESAYQENIYLRGLVALNDKYSSWQPVATTVIARSSAWWYNTITVKGGAKQGFAKDMPCINAEGLVGRILSVSEYTSEVLLITDTSNAVGALIEVSDSPGVVEGMGVGNKVNMIHIPNDARLLKDQVVVTSGLGSVYPKGLRIGYITEINAESSGLMLSAVLTPFVDFERLQYLTILTAVPSDAYSTELEG